MQADKEKRTARLPSVRVTPELLIAIKHEAHRAETTVSKYIRELLYKGRAKARGAANTDTQESTGGEDWRVVL